MPKHNKQNKTFSLDAEILAPGEWSGSVGGKIQITPDHIEQAVNNFRALQDVLDVALKFGHNNEQKLTDGQPAIGWVSDMWVKSGKLMAKFSDMPEIVYEAIKAKRYKNVSIEAMNGVSHKGKDYGFVLSAVALLGADIPAVNTLNDLQTYLTAGDDFQFSSLVNFTATGSDEYKHNGEGSLMTPEEEAKLRADLAAAKAKEIALTAQATAANEALEKKEEENIKIQKDAAFTAEKVELTAMGDKLVKEGKATPAQRDSVLKDLEPEGSANAKAIFETLALSTGGEGMRTDEQGKVDGEDESDKGKTADDVLHGKIVEFSAKHGVPYADAIDTVMMANPKLSREYANITGT